MRGTEEETLPLGSAYEKYAGKPAGSRGWKRALANWNAILAECQKNESEFINGLTKSQKGIMRALTEWWNGSFDIVLRVSDLKNMIEEHANSPNAENPLHFSNLDLVPGGFHTRLALAFASEFYDYPTGRPQSIRIRRNKAGIAAACQRLAYLTYLRYADGNASLRPNTTIPHPSNSPARLPLAVLDPCPWLSDEKNRGLPYYLWDVETRATVRVDDLTEPPTYTIISHTWGRWRVPEDKEDAMASIPGVPWLVPRNSRFDIEQLPKTFAARFKEFTSSRFIWFDLFCIPQDRSEIAEVEISRQAAIFGAADTALCWLNTMDDWRGLRASVQWLAAMYLSLEPSPNHEFDKALSSMEDSLSHPTQLFTEFTQHMPQNSALAHGTDPCGWFTSLWTLQELCLRPDMLLFDMDWVPFRLFDEPSSTLVPLEAILALCAEYVKTHLYDSDVDYPPAVTELFALIEATSLSDVLNFEPLSILTVAGYRECTERRAEAIMSVLGATNWYLETPRELHEQNLVIGQYPIQFIREVRERAGSHFFASLYGTVCCYWDIFEPSGNKSQHHQLGNTWITRVSEVADDYSSAVDSSDDDGLEVDETENPGAEPPEMEVEVYVAGTMLPFDPFQSQSKIIGGKVIASGHPTTLMWSVKDEGVVFMPRVAIIASTDDRLDEGTDQGLIATIMSASEQDVTKMTIMESQNLHEYLRNAFLAYGDPAPKHAVPILCRDDGWMQGVILMQVFEDHVETPVRTFGKLGDFFLKPRDRVVEPQEWEVNWEIL